MRAPLVLAMCLVGPTALAQSAPAQSASTQRPAISEAATSVREALEAIRFGNLANARTALERAGRQDPARADVPYYVGVVDRREQKYDAALAAFRTAVDAAGRSSDTAIGLRARVAVAETLERLDGRMTEAKVAWDDVVAFADAHEAAQPSPVAARARVPVVAARLASDSQNAEVRARIAAREAAASTPARGTHGHSAPR